MASGALIQRVMNRLTPNRARAAVLLYGLRLAFSKTSCRSQNLHNWINYRSFFDAFFHPDKSVWVTLLTPAELLHGLKLSPIVMESVGAITGALGLTKMILKYGVEKGVPSSLCTFHRAHLSLVLKNAFPPPGNVMAVSALCDGNLRALQEISELFPTPFHFLDIPEPETPGAEEFLTAELEEMFFTLAHSLRINDPLPELKKAVARAEETRILMEKVNDLRKTRCLPDLKTMSLSWNLLNHTVQLGSEKGLLFYQSLYNELQEKGKEIPADRKRFLLMHLPPTYSHPVVEVLSSRGGLIVIEEFNTLSFPPFNPEEPFKSIAAKMLSLHLMGSPNRRIDHINRIAAEFGVDGILNFAHWGCRQSAGSIHVLKKYIDTPLLSVETDLVDSESSSAGQVKTRVESFIEMLSR